MKPFNERINGFAAQFKEQMASLYDQGYKQGYSDGLEQRKVADLDYKDGLEYGKEEQEQKDSDSSRRLRFYDEIIYDGNHRGVIIDIASNGIKWVLDSDGSVQALDHDVSYRITGRQFPEILDILDRLQEGGAE